MTSAEPGAAETVTRHGGDVTCLATILLDVPDGLTGRFRRFVAGE